MRKPGRGGAGLESERRHLGCPGSCCPGRRSEDVQVFTKPRRHLSLRRILRAAEASVASPGSRGRLPSSQPPSAGRCTVTSAVLVPHLTTQPSGLCLHQLLFPLRLCFQITVKHRSGYSMHQNQNYGMGGTCIENEPLLFSGLHPSAVCSEINLQ